MSFRHMTNIISPTEKTKKQSANCPIHAAFELKEYFNLMQNNIKFLTGYEANI